jgi:DNA-binding NarL/FixJ family response regulator
MEPKIKILLADDQTLVAESVSAFLSNYYRVILSRESLP